ncbi:MAG: flagellar export chaperone FlgN [Candidatus Poribacteria bacterium]|nr:flagellar export chaperone FlgN [Candidatus Poribacteria bacterium]
MQSERRPLNTPNEGTSAPNQTAKPKVTAQGIIVQALDEICLLLEAEARLTQMLLEQAQSAQRHLVADDYNALLDTAQEQQPRVRQLAQLEHQRVVLTKRLSAYIPGIQKLRLSQWADRLQEPYPTKVRELHANLQAGTAQLQRVNRQNLALIQRSLRFAEMALGQDAATYGMSRTGHYDDSPQLVDRKL